MGGDSADYYELTNMSKENNIGALWLKESEKGKYMSGIIEIEGQKIPIVVFKNSYKKEDKHPDYVILKSKTKSDSENSGKYQNEEAEIKIEDIPF